MLEFATECDSNADPSDSAQRWYVYVLSATDCCGFKVGFTCNPLQRLYAFSPRYFEQFDLYASRLLQVESEADARALELTLKSELAHARVAAPGWVNARAGGRTEWFSGVCFTDAERRLQSVLGTGGLPRLLIAYDVLHHQLQGASGAFESWCEQQARQVQALALSAKTQHAAREAARTLQAWLDAYGYFGIACRATDLRSATRILRFEPWAP